MQVSCSKNQKQKSKSNPSLLVCRIYMPLIPKMKKHDIGKKDALHNLLTFLLLFQHTNTETSTQRHRKLKEEN